MSLSLKLTLLLLFIAGITFLIVHWRSSYRPQTRHPRIRNKPLGGTYAENNGAAKLLADIQALKQKSAQWPEILKMLNPNDEPKIRTVLLELRGPHIFAPHLALNVIESVCLSAERPNDQITRLELLERAKISMESVTRYGD